MLTKLQASAIADALIENGKSNRRIPRHYRDAFSSRMPSNRNQVIRLLCLAVGIAYAALLFGMSIHTGHLTAPAIRESARSSLFVAFLVSVAFLPGSSSARLVRSVRITAWGVVATLTAIFWVSYSGIIFYNGHLASVRLECRERVLAKPEATPASTFAAVSKCFEGSDTE